jgi:hypothetical protein
VTHEPAITDYVTDGYSVKPCVRTASDGKARYYCRDYEFVSANRIDNSRIASAVWVRTAGGGGGNVTVTTVGGKLYEACWKQAQHTYWECNYHVLDYSVRDYNTSAWAYYGGGVWQWALNQAIASTCVYAFYNLDRLNIANSCR